MVTPESTFKNTLWRASEGGRKGLDAARVGRLLEGQFRYRLWDLPSTAEFLPTGALGVGEVLQRIVAEYARRKGEQGFSFWIDHTPRNLRHASALLKLFPEARFIHIVRDGRAVASSVTPLDWGPNTVSAAARWWARRLGEGIVAEGYLAEMAVVDRVHYEDLVTDPESALEGLSRVIFGSQCKFRLDEIGEAMDLPEYTRSQHALIGKAPIPARSEAWRKSLSPAEIEEFEFIAGGLLEHLGYEPDHLAPKGPSMGRKLRRNLKESWQGLANSVRRRARVRRGSA